MSGCVLILTTCGSRAEADHIAEALVTERLAACVQIEAVESVYHWRGAVERAQEWRLQIKTMRACAEEAEYRIAALHSYDLPEIVRLPFEGMTAYLDWIAASVR